ncbi:hypothetical protein VNO77_18740 [Canavalia gladiata]|uniref:60S acidic ribosomal protein P1 n=1 Tax=Canavalia gladiata TaxID=3824 RepID=A0AAN9LL97_CANGL
MMVHELLLHLLNPQTLNLQYTCGAAKNSPFSSRLRSASIRSVKMSIGPVASTYAALILNEDNIPITPENITTVLKTANIKVEAFWPTIFAKLAEKRNVGDLIASAAGGGAPVAVAAAPVAAAGGGAAAAAPAKEEKKEEPQEESDDDMGFSLFD